MVRFHHLNFDFVLVSIIMLLLTIPIILRMQIILGSKIALSIIVVHQLLLLVLGLLLLIYTVGLELCCVLIFLRKLFFSTFFNNLLVMLHLNLIAIVIPTLSRHLFRVIIILFLIRKVINTVQSLILIVFAVCR